VAYFGDRDIRKIELEKVALEEIKLPMGFDPVSVREPRKATYFS